MRDPRAFITLERATPRRQDVAERVEHWNEFYKPLPEHALRAQGERCMDCGVPFCQSDHGCPTRNDIPEWNALMAAGRWRDALAALHATNSFPEFTGRLCPAPCESACVLGLIQQPVAIRAIEQAIVDRGFDEGWIAPRLPVVETGRTVAVIGSGPAGLAAAQQLRRQGHGVVVFEKDDRIGGLLRYGIPEFKMEKSVLDRRLSQLMAEGVVFRTGVAAGDDIAASDLRRDFDAICLATGAAHARELPVRGRKHRGIHQAMAFLTQQNRRDAGDVIAPAESITAHGRHVVIIGGGDTGSDCAGTCHRQGAASVRQIELLGEPPVDRSPSTPWPVWPMQLRTSHAHEEGCDREWGISTLGFTGREGSVTGLRARRVDTGEYVNIEADLVLLAMGFTGPTPSRLVTELGVDVDPRGAVKTDAAQRTSVGGVYAVGDVHRGASLIVWGIREGRDAAESIDAALRVA
jgi:glutamate synthase (NADPH/NADH) small chain